MAQTKTQTRSKNGRSKPTKAAKRKVGAVSSQTKGQTKARSKQRRSSAKTGGSKTGGHERRNGAAKAVQSTAKQAGNVVEDAGQTVGRAAKKAKTPLLAGGAAIAGAAGGLALGAHQARKSKLVRPKLKVRTQDVARAARDVGQFGMDVGQLAAELRSSREGKNGASRRSPIEVVLDGLTHRKNRSAH